MPQQACFQLAGGNLCLSAGDTKGKLPLVSDCGDRLTRNVSELTIYITSRPHAAETTFLINLSLTSAIGQETKRGSFIVG
jgi:hypothetical protein